MSGTPVENRLAELWSVFEFLNPGMLGAAPAFARLAGSRGSPGGDELAVVARTLRPFILRRTKGEVARDLPERTEQTIWVELSADERTLSDELRAHYRSSLLGRVDQDGLARSKMHVLEALLRLRQAACHPGLIDPARAAEPSSKLEVLLSRVAETVGEGHKALVFSQFTSLVESRSGGAGDRPRAPDRADAAGVRRAAHRSRHGRREGAGPAAGQACAGRRDRAGRPGPDRDADPG